MNTESTNDVDRLKASFEACISEQQFALAAHHAAQLWYTAPSLATANFIKARANPLIKNLKYHTKRLVILRSFSVETMIPALEAYGLNSRFCLDIRLGQYNAYMQELMDAENGSANSADAVLLALHTRTAAPALWNSKVRSEMEEASEWLSENMLISLETFRRSASAPLIIQGLDMPQREAGDSNYQERRNKVTDTNIRLSKIASSIPDCHFFTIDTLTEAENADWYDSRNWNIAKVPFRNAHTPQLAMLWFQRVRPVLASPAKVIVSDLDNTLWGGILGEDGPNNLAMGQGTGYDAIQEALLSLRRKGFLLAIVSKNEEKSALSVLSSHADCLVRPEDIVSHRINWLPKSQNIQSLADELNLGLDSFVFLDDNPVERAEVATSLPSVRVLPFLSDPSQNAHMLMSHPDMQRLKVTQEDARRTSLYKTRQQRNISEVDNPAQRRAFLKSLHQEVIFEELSEEVFVRAAELERKTNQFNLRTRRFTEADIRGFASHPSTEVFAFRVIDRFGDNGVVGVVIISLSGGVAHIENFLMSCRVIGRDVEYLALQVIVHQIKQRGVKKVFGSFEPTAKNTPARKFYSHAGFSLYSIENDVEYWQTALSADGLLNIGS